MKEVDSTLLYDLTVAVYSVINKNKLEPSKENAEKIVTALGEFCSSLCAISNLDIDDFTGNVKEVYEEISGSESLVKYRDEFEGKSRVKEAEPVDNTYENVESLSGFKDKKFVKDSIFGADISYAQTMFESVYDKMLDIMQEKNVMTSDMPVMIGCLGAVGAYFSEIYNVDKDLIVKTINEYYKSLEEYETLSDSEKEAVLSSYQPNDKVKEVSKDATVIKFPSKKGPYNLN